MVSNVIDVGAHVIDVGAHVVDVGAHVIDVVAQDVVLNVTHSMFNTFNVIGKRQ